MNYKSQAAKIQGGAENYVNLDVTPAYDDRHLFRIRRFFKSRVGSGSPACVVFAVRLMVLSIRGFVEGFFCDLVRLHVFATSFRGYY